MKLLALSLLACVAALLAIYLPGILSTRTLADITGPDGTRFTVEQSFNYDPELFTTRCFSYSPDGTQRCWYYYDHEDDYWGESATTTAVDPARKLLIVYRHGQEAVTFNYQTRTCHLVLRLGWFTQEEFKPRPPG